jgi:hypothetical protein
VAVTARTDLENCTQLMQLDYSRGNLRDTPFFSRAIDR